MDSQEKTLEQGKTEELNKAVENAAPATEKAEDEATPQVDNTTANNAEAEKAPERKVYTNKKEVLDRVKEIAHSDDAPEKEEVDYLKTAFYKLHIAEREAKLKAYLEEGGDPDNYQITPDEDEEAFKAEMGIIKEKRAKIFKEQEEEKEANLKKKEDIIEKIKAMATSPEEANKSYQDFKALQQEWKEIKNVPAPKANELWRNYQLYVEQFYDLLKLNSEAREYDFKKNLEMKTKLCEAAEKLADDSDVISAFHQLQKLHQEYRETGPVAKELREQIWARFKAASTVINKRHQQHFEDLRAKEEDNLARKTALCEKVEAIGAETIKRLGETHQGDYCHPDRVEDHRIRSTKDEREDFRALPHRLRRLLRTQSGVLQAAQRDLQDQCRQKAGTHRTGQRIERQHRLESYRRQTDCPAKGMENHRHRA